MTLPFIDFSLSGKPGFWEFGILGFRNHGFLGIRDSGLIRFPGIRIPKQGYQQPLLSTSHEALNINLYHLYIVV